MPIQQDNSLGNLAGILGAIPGLSQAINGSKETTSTSIPQNGLNYLLQQILSSNQGLAAVAGSQNTAGLYNSTVQTQMVNDLLARSSGEVASKTATTTTQRMPTLSLGDTLLQGAAGLIGTKLLTKGVDTLGSTLASALGLGESTAAGGAAAGSSLLAGVTGTAAPAFSVAGGVPTAVANASLAGAAASEAGAAGAAGTADAAATGLGTALGETGAGAIGAGLGSALGLGTAGAVGAATAGGLAAGGATLGGLGGAIAGDVAASSAGIAAAAGLGADAAGGVAAAGGIGDALAAVAPLLAWVVCTELVIQGEMNVSTYHKAKPDFLSRSKGKPSALRGYHYWAVPYTRIMRRKDWIGRLARIVIRPLAVGRANHIAGNWNIAGWITFAILEPICSLLGNTVARKSPNWKALYANKGE